MALAARLAGEKAFVVRSLPENSQKDEYREVTLPEMMTVAGGYDG